MSKSSSVISWLSCALIRYMTAARHEVRASDLMSLRVNVFGSFPLLHPLTTLSITFLKGVL